MTEELKSTLQRLEHSPAAMDTSQATKLLETLSTLKVVTWWWLCMLRALRFWSWRPLLREVRLELTGAFLQDLVPAEVDTTMAKSFHVAQVLMQEIVQSVTDHDVQLKSVLTKLEAAAGDAAIREEVAKAKKQLDTMAKDLDRMQDTHREYVVVEGSKADLVRAQAALVTDLQGKVADLTGQLEQAERRLVLSEGAVRAAREAGPAADTPTAAGGSSADAGGDAQQRNLEYKHQADSRLEEIKTLQKTIIQLTEQNGAAAAYAPQEVSENMILQSPAYVALSEQLKAAEKECKTYHMAKITHLNVELAQEREKQQRERREVEMQHQHKIKQVLLESQRKSNEVMEAKQEIKSLQFKLEQKSVGEISTKRAQELEETLQKAQAECARLRKEHDALRARPDAEELRREFREEKEKLWKERDTELNKANDLAEQVKERDKRIEALVAAAKGGEGANGVNGPDAAHRKEVEGLEAEVKGLRTDKKELTRRFQKAERGFNECNKLYQQHKKDKEETMKDLESLGLSFEEMQEQNTRLLQTMKQKDEEHNELLRQRIKERQEREMIADEKNALKLKLDKTEEVLKARQDAIDKLKRDLENLQQEQAKKMKEDECSAAIVAEHRKMLLFREAQGKESRREAEKARNALAELQKAKQEAERDLHEARFEKTRVEETLESTQRRLERLVPLPSTRSPLPSLSLEDLRAFFPCLSIHVFARSQLMRPSCPPRPALAVVVR